MRGLQYMGFAAFMPGEIIFKQGDSGDHFYIILSGAVDVSVDEGQQVCSTPSHQLVTISSLHRLPIIVLMSNLAPCMSQPCFGQALDASSKAKAVWHIQGDKVVAHLLSGAAFGELALMQVHIVVLRTTAYAFKHHCDCCDDVTHCHDCT